MARARVAARYAKALLSLAQERKEMDVVGRDLDLLSALFRDSRDLVLLLQSPIIKSDKKQAVLDAVLQDHLGELVSSYLRILVNKGREGLVVDMVTEGQSQLRALRNIQSVSVTTAFPLTDSLRDQIMAQVANVHKGDVDLTETVDPEILGGYMLKMGDQMIDASVKRHLRTLGRELTEHDYEPEF
ncbi:MAG: ATP synthase F1 subunit delta [Bacteroidetes bacterium]|jgi:F-type H+-transporting ATPase subunit delta|nr:ATP synthase F1 subunit delta [Bacteroidota bacterium]